MSSAKHSLDASDDEGLEVFEPQSSILAERQETHKRARVSDTLTVPRHNSHVSQLENGSPVIQATLTQARSFAERLNIPDGDINEDDDTERATQIIQRRNKKKMDNSPADHGIIETVTCINFMCHTKLHVSFGPLINFIIGHNGSGKSAVLTAITLCLGGKAASTNRGQSLKSFIKEGQESGALIVKLKNTGSGAYQNETFGDSIIIERHFSKSGASGFKLKAIAGRLISTKKGDLEEICDYFALQIDNPMNVLSQDNARQFLNNSSPSEKYKFFVRGVQLEQLDHDYRLLEQFIDDIEVKLEGRAKEELIELTNRAQRADARLQFAKKGDQLRMKIMSYGRQMAWAQVEQQEEQLRTFEKELQNSIQRVTESEKRAEEIAAEYNKACLTAEAAKEDTKAANELLEPIKEKKNEIKQKFEKNKSELLNLHTEQRQIRESVHNSKNALKKCQENVAAELRRLEDVNGGSHGRRLGEIEAAKGRVSEIKNRHDDLRDELVTIEEAVKAAKAHNSPIDRSQRRFEDKKREIRECEATIQNLTRNRGDQWAGFDSNMSRLLQAISEERGFHEKPIGPAGLHIRLLKPAWANILERSIGGMLSSFIVTSKQDQVLLTSIMRRFKINSNIIIGNHHPIDTSRNEPDPHFITVLRILEFDNELVKRQLIINQAIEQTLLIQDVKEARGVMYSGNGVQKVNQCLCFHPTKRGFGVRLKAGHNSSQSPIEPYSGKPRMKGDIEPQINYHKESLISFRKDLHELEQEHKRLIAEVRVEEQEFNRKTRELSDLSLNLQRAEDHVDNLQDEIDRDNVQDGHLDALKILLSEAEVDQRISSNSYEESVLAKDRLNNAASILNKELHDVDMEISEAEAIVTKAELKAKKLDEIRILKLQEKNQSAEVIEDANHLKQTAEENIQEQTEIVQKFVNDATSISERVTVAAGETPASLDAKLDKLSKDLKRFNEKMGGSIETLEEEALEARNIHIKAKTQLNDLELLAQHLKMALLDRTARWQQFQRFISARARAQFTYLLSERSFRGALKTDHKLRILDLHVEPDETKTGKGRQTKTLSGGEKSFSTICLLLSLWEAMGSPIRCLDEFDVFMDNVNRDVSLKMIITAARRSVGRQYVFITPQSMNNVDVGGDVKIIKLNDPERGQTALPFSAQ